MKGMKGNVHTYNANILKNLIKFTISVSFLKASQVISMIIWIQSENCIYV